MKDEQARLQQLSGLIELIYEGALHLPVWQELPRHIAEWMEAPVCTLFTPLHTPAQGGFMGAHNISPGAMALWHTKYLPHDIWAQRAIERGLSVTGQVMRDQELVTEEEFTRSLIYREYFAPMDTGRLASAVIFGTEGSTNLTTICSCTRPLRNPFSEDDAFKLRLILPHLSRALGVMFRLRAADFRLASSLAALDLLAQGVVLFDGKGRVFHANRRAHEIFELERDGEGGLALQAHLGQRDRLLVRSPAEQSLLDATIQAALSPAARAAPHFSSALVLRSAAGRPGYSLNFSALPAGNEFGHGADVPRAIAFIGDPCARIEPDLESLRQRFGLTPTEVRVARQALDGESVAMVAEALGLSVNTAKTHLRRIYDKTGTGSRALLLRLVLSTAVPAALD